MYSAEFIRFLVGRDVDDYKPNETKETANKTEPPLYRYSRYATIPIEIKKQV